MKLVTPPATLSDAAGFIFKSIGLGSFVAEAFRPENRDALVLRLYRAWEADGRDVNASEDALIDWLHKVASELKHEILASDLVKNRLDDKDKTLAEMTRRMTELSAQVQGLLPYRLHYEMEFELKHGRTRDDLPTPEGTDDASRTP